MQKAQSPDILWAAALQSSKLHLILRGGMLLSWVGRVTTRLAVLALLREIGGMSVVDEGGDSVRSGAVERLSGGRKGGAADGYE